MINCCLSKARRRAGRVVDLKISKLPMTFSVKTINVSHARFIFWGGGGGILFLSSLGVYIYTSQNVTTLKSPYSHVHVQFNCLDALTFDSEKSIKLRIFIAPKRKTFIFCCVLWEKVNLYIILHKNHKLKTNYTYFVSHFVTEKFHNFISKFTHVRHRICMTSQAG